MKTKLRKLWTVIAAALCAVLLCSAAVFGGCATAKLSGGKENNKSTAAAALAPPATVPTITWSAVNALKSDGVSYYATSQTGCYQKHVSSNNWWAISEMGSPNSSYGNCKFYPNYSTSSYGTPVARADASRTEYKVGSGTPHYVHFKTEITIPAYTKYEVKYNMYVYIYPSCPENSSTTPTRYYGWADLCWYGAAGDTSDTMHFGYHDNGSSNPAAEVSYSGTVSYRLHAKSKRNNSGTNSYTVTTTYTNNTGSDQTFTRYCGFFANCQVGGTYKYKYDAYATVTPETPTFIEYVGPAKPSVEDSEKEKTYNGNWQDFAIKDIGLSTLVEVKHRIAGTDNVLYTYDPDTVTTTGNSHMTGNNLSVKDAGLYTLKFKRDPATVQWDDGDTDDYCEVTVEMKPKPLAISWATQAYNNGLTGTNSMFFMLPSPNVTVGTAQFLSAVKYYERNDYDTGTGKVVAGASDVSLANLQQDTDYYAVVDFDTTTAGYNYTFDGDNFCAFSTRDGRQIVVVTVKNSGETYDGSSHPAIAEAVTTTGDPLIVGTDIDFRYTYYLAGDPVYDTGSTVPPTNAGTYTLKVEIKPTYDDDFKPFDNMTFTYKIEKADPVLDPILANPAAQLYTGNSLPALAAGASGTAGTYSFDAGQTLLLGAHDYSYTFTPTDTSNYNTVKDMFELVAYDAKINSITATFDPDPDGDGVAVDIYDSWKLDDLIPYLTIEGTDETGGIVSPLYGYTLSGTLTAGTSTITVKYGSGADEVQCTFTVNNVIACVLQSISATFSQDGKVFTSTNVDDLKVWLEVRGTYNDGRDHGLIDGTDYDLTVDDPSGELTVGVSTIDVSYWHEGVKYTTSFPVNVKPVVLDSIQADFQPGLNKITSTTALRVLKNWLTVTGTNNDGSDFETSDPDNKIDANDYALSGKLVGGTTSKITVKYQGKSTTFDVDVETSPYDGKRTLIPVPVIDQLSYTGNEIDIISGWAHIALVDCSGNKYTSAGKYTLILTIKDFDQYEWDTTSLTPVKAGTKGLAKYALADDFVGYTIDDDTLTAEWEIAPAVLKGTWNESGTLDLVSTSYKGSCDGLIGYKYFDSNGNEVTELYEGAKYYVLAELLDTNNFVLDESTAELLSTPYEYTVPKTTPNAFEKAWNTVKETMMQTWMGLPIWAWALIALAVLILLIIIIVVACKRRKSKEEKEEIKARREEERLRKEEEKQRREEEREAERQRREDERRLQQEKLEAERELAKAKQEAELEKIRAQAQAGMVGAGMATMAVAQPQQQVQPVQQPVQQVVDNTNNELLKEMRQQMAELRADNKATQAQLQAMQNSQNNQAMPAHQPMQYPMYPQYQQMPMMPQYPQMPMQSYGGDPTLARLEAQLNAMQAEQRARYDAEQRIELAAMRAEQHVDRDSRHSVDLAAMREHINGHNYNRIPDYSQQSYNQQPNSMDMMGALVAATLRNMANGELAATQSVPELPQKTETATPAAKYPSDAVITTTTTVDTTKNGAIRRDENFDIDGFYDPLD
ncbi:MAG: hypothetical protein K2N22_00200 [Clostridia bacterium]|nr:hypothetical protein [Clostridia bacterium]